MSIDDIPIYRCCLCGYIKSGQGDTCHSCMKTAAVAQNKECLAIFDEQPYPFQTCRFCGGLFLSGIAREPTCRDCFAVIVEADGHNALAILQEQPFPRSV